MQIKHSRTVYETLDLSDYEVNEITRRRLKQLITPGEYLRLNSAGKRVLMQDDPHHRHGSISEIYVRDATELDIAVCLVLKSL